MTKRQQLDPDDWRHWFSSDSEDSLSCCDDEVNDIKKQHDEKQQAIQKLDALIVRYSTYKGRFDVLKHALAEHQSSKSEFLARWLNGKGTIPLGHWN